MGQERICGRHEVAAQMEQKMGCLDIQLGNTFFVLVSSFCRFLDDKAYCSMVTRNGFLSEILKNMRRATEIMCFSHR